MEIPAPPVKAIKNILLRELESHNRGFYNAYPQFIMSDVQKNMVQLANDLMQGRLKVYTTYEELDDYIREFYCMSLVEWVESL